MALEEKSALRAEVRLRSFIRFGWFCLCLLVLCGILLVSVYSFCLLTRSLFFVCFRRAVARAGDAAERGGHRARARVCCGAPHRELTRAHHRRERRPAVRARRARQWCSRMWLMGAVEHPSIGDAFEGECVGCIVCIVVFLHFDISTFRGNHSSRSTYLLHFDSLLPSPHIIMVQTFESAVQNRAR